MTLSLDNVSQIGITIFGVSAILLVSKKNKWGFVAGILSQPFWYITSYVHKQWGVFFVSFIYSATWIFGCYEWFIKDKKITIEQEASQK